MATLTEITDGSQATRDLGVRIVKAEVLVDFAVTPASNGDVVQVLNIPAGAKLMQVDTVIKTPEGGVLTANIGDATDPNGWDALIDLDAAAETETRSLPGTDALATIGKFYPTADTLDLTLTADADTAAVVVTAVYMFIEQFA